MPVADLVIDPDLRQSGTLPGAVASDPEIHALAQRIFARTWRLFGFLGVD